MIIIGIVDVGKMVDIVLTAPKEFFVIGKLFIKWNYSCFSVSTNETNKKNGQMKTFSGLCQNDKNFNQKLVGISGGF